MTVRRLTNELKKIPFLKVNSIFTGQFTVQQRDELKHIQTRNSVITRDTNLKEWYDQFIKAEILRELEEFQVSDLFKYETCERYAIFDRNETAVGP